MRILNGSLERATLETAGISKSSVSFLMIDMILLILLNDGAFMFVIII